MAEYLIQGESLTALADEIRELSGTTSTMGLDSMATRVGEANTEVGSQTDLIAQIASALEGKAVGGGSSVDDVSKAIITRTIVEASDNEIDTIGAYAFYGCSNLTTANFPAVTNIGINAFSNCSSLANINMSAAQTIGINAFGYCRSLTTVDFPAVTSIGNSAFFYCYNLNNISFPVCKSIGNSVFGNCSKLLTVSFPSATSIGGSAFNSCIRLTSVSFPVVASIGSYAFAYCYDLTTARFPEVTSIGSNAFYYCNHLTRLYLAGSSICSLRNSNAFSNTQYAGDSSPFLGIPCIYVPSSLIAAYQSATNWTYFSSYFSAIESLGDSGGKIITFTIDGVVYQAEEGMTWTEWCDSPYNTDGFLLQVGYIRNFSVYGGAVVCFNDGQTYVNATTNSKFIIFNYNYVLANPYN